MPVSPGQIYESCHPLDEGRRIRVLGEPGRFHGVYGYGKVTVETIDDNGRGVRRRAIEVSQLHDSGTTRTGQARRTGYRLVEDAE
ncbi:hypothetical protein [Streptosporangium sp. NPDC051022]|uniref:hypothetical protein n=1 Tax=Streptosporangium sp. NPDC051022 TaxID=3155752 RepID=UPI00343D03A5